MDTHVPAEEGLCAAFADRVSLRTEAPQQFIDVTELVAERVRRSQVQYGLASLQTCHPTTAVAVDEDQPRLLEDLRLLGVSQTLQVAEGALQLGRRQRLFFVELDGPRTCTLSILVLGMVGA
jgi:thiamine phosphate synthase YjbQ (UPF0047 family)